MTIEELIKQFKAFESQGFYLHPDLKQTQTTINSLIENNKKYGHLACPCRLATGNYNDDEDIICPCVYCKDDVNEFGACYCLLFVREDFKDDVSFYPDIDDRRPPDKVK